MRHIWSLVTGVVFAPLAWILIALGHAAMGTTITPSADLDFMLGGLMIIGTGLLLGLIGSLRTSPAGALFVAAVYLGFSVYYLLAGPKSILDLLNDLTFTLGDYTIQPVAPLMAGHLGIIGGTLLMAAFSVSRWRNGTTAAGPDTGSDTLTEPGGSTPATTVELDQSS